MHLAAITAEKHLSVSCNWPPCCVLLSSPLLQPYHQQYLSRGGRFNQPQDASKGCNGETSYAVSLLLMSCNQALLVCLQCT
jgi:hypothetical protein